MRTAVLAIDLQEQFVGADALFPVPGGAALVERVGPFLTSVRSTGTMVIFTRYRLPAAYPAGRTTQRLDAPGAHRGHAADLAAGLTPSHADLVLDKPRQSAFTGTCLDLTLRRFGVEHVLVIGVTTHACCLATAIDAAAHDYRVTVVDDLTAAPAISESGVEVMSADEVHRCALRFIRSTSGDVVDARTALARLAPAESGET